MVDDIDDEIEPIEIEWVNTEIKPFPKRSIVIMIVFYVVIFGAVLFELFTNSEFLM